MKQATMPARLEHAAAWLQTKTNARPKTGLILGSGLGDFCDLLENVTEVPFSDIPDFPVATVAGHTGAFLFGTYQGTPVAVLRGRIHCYEGYTPQEVVMPVRLMAMLGVKTVILTNAAGGVNKAYKPGALMLLEDHINFCGANPLTGPNLDQLGPRFPDMSDVYCRQLRERVQELALAEQLPLEQGIYLMYGGPSYETPAEIRAWRGCRRYVDGTGSHRSKSLWEARAWNLMHYEHGRRHSAAKAQPRRSRGGGSAGKTALYPAADPGHCRGGGAERSLKKTNTRDTI